MANATIEKKTRKTQAIAKTQQTATQASRAELKEAIQTLKPAFELSKPTAENVDSWTKAVKKAVRESLEKETAAELLSLHKALKAKCYENFDSETMSPVPCSYTYVYGLSDHAAKKAAIPVTLRAQEDGTILAQKGTGVAVTLKADDKGYVMLSGEVVKAARQGYTWDNESKASHKRLVADLTKYLTDKRVLSVTKFQNLVELCERRLRQSIASMLVWQVMTHGLADKPNWLTIPEVVVATTIKKEDSKPADMRKAG